MEMVEWSAEENEPPFERAVRNPETVSLDDLFSHRGVLQLQAFGASRLEQSFRVLRGAGPDGQQRSDIIEMSGSRSRSSAAGYGPWDDAEHWRADGDVVAMAARMYGDLLLALRDEDGLHVERWIFSAPEGAWTATRPVALPGVPVATPPALIEVKGHDRWHDIATCSSPHEVTAHAVRTFARSDALQGLSVDPDGRFFLAVWEDRIESFALDGSGEGTRVFVGDGRIQLSRIGRLIPMDCQGGGRVFHACHGGLNTPRMDLVLIDRENDGIFDECRFVDDSSRPWLESIYRKADFWYGYSDATETRSERNRRLGAERRRRARARREPSSCRPLCHPQRAPSARSAVEKANPWLHRLEDARARRRSSRKSASEPQR